MPGQVAVSGSTLTFTAFESYPFLSDVSVAATVGLSSSSGLPLVAPDAWSFATRDLSWSDDVDLDDSATTVTSPVTVDIADDGSAVAVWLQRDGAIESVYASRLTGTWSSPQAIETSAADASFPAVAFSSSSFGIAVWIQNSGVVASVFDDGSWGAAQVIDNDTGAPSASSPAIVVDASRRALAVWSQSDGTRTNIWSARFDGSWAVAAKIETEDLGNASLPSAAMNEAGVAFAVWQQDNGADINVWANRFVPGAGWETATKIENKIADALKPVVAVADAGNAVALFELADPSYQIIFFNYYSPGSGWGTTSEAELDSVDSTEPSIAVLGSGFVAAWLRADPGNNAVVASFFSVADGWTPTAALDSFAGTTIRPRVAANDRQAVVSWLETSTNVDLVARRWLADTGAWDAVRPLESQLSNASSQSVTMNEYGETIVGWSQVDPTNSAISNARSVMFR